MMSFRHLRATSLAAAAALTVGTLALATPAAHAQTICVDDLSHTNCDWCLTSDGPCASCKPYTGLNAEKKCVRCHDSNCKYCSKNFTKCDTCMENHLFSDRGTCVSIDAAPSLAGAAAGPLSALLAVGAAVAAAAAGLL